MARTKTKIKAKTGPRSTAKPSNEAESAGLVKFGSRAVLGLLVVVLGWGLWVSVFNSSAGTARDEAAAVVAPLPPAVPAAPDSDQAVSPWEFEALGSPDAEIVAAAAVDLRDEWFYADNDVLMASVDAVFVTAVSPGAIAQLEGLTAQRASLWDAPQSNKTYYHSEALSTTVLGEDAGDVLVEVWAMEVISRRNLIEPMTQWTRERLMMSWADDVGRWQVSEWTVVEGPTPTLLPQVAPSTASELEFDLEGHARVRDWLGLAEWDVS